MAERFASGTTFLELSAKRASLIPIPLAPIKEQYKIVEELEKLFSISNKIKKNVSDSLKKSNNLHQSILKRAFEGKLIQNEKHKQKLVEEDNIENIKSKFEENKNSHHKLKQKNLSEYVK